MREIVYFSIVWILLVVASTIGMRELHKEWRKNHKIDSS